MFWPEIFFAMFQTSLGIFLGWLMIHRVTIRDLKRRVKELEGPKGYEFTAKTYRAAYRRAVKISDQAMIDHIRCLRGPEASVKWGHTAYLIKRRYGRKVGAFWALYVYF